MKKLLFISFSLLIFTLTDIYAHQTTHQGQNGPSLYSYGPPQLMVHHHYVHDGRLSLRQHHPNSTAFLPETNRNFPLGRRPSDPTFANAVGAALGGLAGSKLGKGSGKLATTAAGTMFGYFLGGRLVAPR